MFQTPNDPIPFKPFRFLDTHIMKTSASSSEVSVNLNGLKITTRDPNHRSLGVEEPSLLAYANSPLKTSMGDLVFPIPPSRTVYPLPPKFPAENPPTLPTIYPPTTDQGGNLEAGSGHHALLETLAMVASSERVQGPHSSVGTIHGRITQDLLSSKGPVPIKFDLNPPRALPVRQSSVPPVISDTSHFSAHLSPSSSLPPGSSPPYDQPLARTNFSPAVQTTRPRSRSFSAIINAIETPR